MGKSKDSIGNGYEADASLAIHEDQVSDYSAGAEKAQAVSEASVVQMAPGPEPSNLTVFSSRDITAIRLSHHAPSVGVVILKPEFFGIMWWQGSKEVRINGDLAEFTNLYTQGEQDGFHAAGGERTTMGIAVRRNHLVETVAALRGVGAEDVCLKHAVLPLLNQSALQFRKNFDFHIQNAIAPGKSPNTSASLDDTAEVIFGLLIAAYLQSSPEPEKQDRLQSPERVVRKAEERFFAAGENQISLADLCKATGVSQSTLYRAFHHVCDQPPLLYFHKRRLHDARKALVKSPAVRGAVKRIALSSGLTELGRFSGEYQRLYGELPSTTLGRQPPT